MAVRARLQKIVDQARVTFSMRNPSKDPLYKENLEKLKEAVSTHVCLSLSVLLGIFNRTACNIVILYILDERCKRRRFQHISRRC